MSPIAESTAEIVAWEAPGGVPMSIAAGPTEGILEVHIENGAVNIQGTNCTFIVGVAGNPDRASVSRVLAEVRMTIALSRCQVTWKMVDAGQ